MVARAALTREVRLEAEDALLFARRAHQVEGAGGEPRALARQVRGAGRAPDRECLVQARKRVRDGDEPPDIGFSEVERLGHVPVIPGRREVPNPESVLWRAVHGFRARATHVPE